MMRTESAYSVKGKRRGKGQQKIPRAGSKVRGLWDLLHLYKGEIVTLPLSLMFHNTAINHLRDFYGLDIRNLGGDGHGRKRMGSRWILAGEWFGSRYVDYISQSKKKLLKVERELAKDAQPD